MRNPENVLESLKLQANNPNYKYQRLYRNLYNLEFYLRAYGNIQSNPGNMTKGTDGKTIDGMSIKRVDKLIEELRDFSYQPAPARRVYIPKTNGKLRPLGVPSFEDKLVQEVIRMILESIYEPSFLNCSHGFRPKRSCHTAMAYVKSNFTGVKWFVEGDIKGCFDNIDHHVLINILRRRIQDEQFISLIWKFLKAGYMESWEYHNTYSGTPQGSIISPILANIYMNELDIFMMEYTAKFNRGRKRNINPEFKKKLDVCRGKEERLKRNWNKYSEKEISDLRKEIRNLRKELKTIPYGNPMDENYRRITYVRYADDFLIGIIGNKKDAEKIKVDVGEFIKTGLHLEMSDEKTLVTHGTDFAHFLGFDVAICSEQRNKTTAKGYTKRSLTGKVTINVPKEKWMNRLIHYGVLKIHYDKKDGHEIWEPVRRTELMNLEDWEIVRRFNAEIRGLYNYYRIANNVSVLNNFYYVMQYSMLKTFAGKYKTHISRIWKKYRKNKDFVVTYTTAKGTKEVKFYHDGFRYEPTPLKWEHDKMDVYVIRSEHREIDARIRKQTCELCKQQCNCLEIHHVKTLKRLKGETEWEKQMLHMHRKTLALCPECHAKIHNTLD